MSHDRDSALDEQDFIDALLRAKYGPTWSRSRSNRDKQEMVASVTFAVPAAHSLMVPNLDGSDRGPVTDDDIWIALADERFGPTKHHDLARVAHGWAFAPVRAFLDGTPQIDTVRGKVVRDLIIARFGSDPTEQSPSRQSAFAAEVEPYVQVVLDAMPTESRWSIQYGSGRVDPNTFSEDDARIAAVGYNQRLVKSSCTPWEVVEDYREAKDEDAI